MSLSPDQIEGQELTKHRVLIADDNPQNREVAKRAFFGREGVVVDFATDRKTALDKLENGKYNIVISDLYMPDETGTGNKEQGVEATYNIVRLFQQKLLSNDIERKRLEESEGFNRSEYTRVEFDELVSATKGIRNAYEIHKEDDEIAESISYYEDAGGEGEWLRDVIDSDRQLDQLGLSDKKEQFLRISGNVSNKFGGWGGGVIEAATMLASPDEANQPMGWNLAEYAKNRNMKYLILSSEAHKGYGSGVQNMLSTVFELGKESAFASVEEPDDPENRITPATKFVIGDKRNPEIWKKATIPLLESKK